MKPKYFLLDVLGGVMLLIGIMLFIKSDYEFYTIIISSVGLLLILLGEYFKGLSYEGNQKLEDKHYETIITLYKYTGGIIALLIGIAAWIIGGNINETRDSANKELENLKSELKEIKSDSDQAVKDTRSEADKQIEHLRKNTELFLTLTKNITSMQIETIREDAKNLALSSARTRVDEAFKANNVQDEIQKALQNEIGNNLERIVQNEMEDMPLITSLGVKMSFWEDRSALDQLDSIANFADNPTSKIMAAKHLSLKGVEFEKEINPILMSEFSLKIFNPDSILTRADSLKVKKELIKAIFNENNAWTVSYAFVILRKFSGINLNNFDFNAVRRLRKELE